MKLMLILICGFGLLGSIAENTYAQTTKLTLDLKDASIKDVLLYIEDHSEFSFMYDNNDVDVNRKVNIKVKDETIDSILNQLFADEPITTQTIGRHIIIVPEGNSTEEILVQQQEQKTVSGKVTDTQNQPLPGVTVVVKGTTQGTVSNADGEYSLSNIPGDATLQFSFVGMKTQEVIIGNQTRIDVRMEEETIGLEEVVAIGYGIQKKSQVTGAISSVKAEEMENRVFTDPSLSMQGKTSGVQIYLSSGQPGTTGTVRVRGMGSNSNNDPLYVVDGTQVSDISYLNPNDIESMEVLKDASAAAIYGARAGNGVILVTTKRGKVGTESVTYNTMFSWQTNNNIPTMLNAQKFYDYQMKLGSSNQSALDSDWGDKTTDTDWLEEIFTNGFLQNHSISFSGGSEKITYYTGFSANINDGAVIGQKDKYKRYTGTINSDYQVKKWLKLSTQNQLTYFRTEGDRDLFEDVFQAAMHFSPLITPAVAEPTAHMRSYLNAGYSLIRDKNGNYATLPVFSSGDDENPILTLNKTKGWRKWTGLHGSTSAILTPFSGFAFTSRFGYSFDGSRSYEYTRPGVYSSQASSYNATVGGTSSNSTRYQWENFANYNKSFGKNNLTFMAGMSFKENQYYYVTGTVQGTGTDTGFTGSSDLYAYFAYKSGGASQGVGGGEEEVSREISYYGRINYDYDNKYFLQASLRADAADLAKLPMSGRWGYFPAVSAGWTISNEDFMKDIRGLSHLKFRVSWGQNGSTAGLGSYAWQSVVGQEGSSWLGGYVYSFTPNQMDYISTKVPTTAGNKDLTWETSEQFDIGLDTRFLNDRLSFSYDWYNKTTKDLILTDITQSYIVGVASSPFNAGEVVNKGHEFDLVWRDKIGKDFSYSISANFATLKNEVKEITNALTYIEGEDIDSSTLTWFEQGYPMWHFKTYHYTGVDENGNPTFYDANNSGGLDSDDKVDCGSGIPTYTYGLTLNANWKNFDLVVFGSGQGGNEIFQFVTRAFQLNSNVPEYLLNDAWTEDNKNTNIPKVGMDNIGYYYLSDAQIFKGDYFKLKQIQLGYTLPLRLTSKINIDKLRLYVSAENVFTITDYPGFDPEIMSSGNTVGIDSGKYPNNRNFIVGLNLTF